MEPPSQSAGLPDLGRLRPTEPVGRLFRDLRSRPGGLSSREAARRRIVFGPNELRRRGGVRWPGELARQLVHPLALLLWVAAALALVDGTAALAGAIVAVILLNAAVAFAQERQAERAVEALAHYLPQSARALRDGRLAHVPASELVPGDVIAIDEGERISADARLLAGAVEVDLSALTGESVPAVRAAELVDVDRPLALARDLVFSGTTCTGGSARAIVFATGMRTEIGRIAALSERVGRDRSPLERQVQKLAWIIGAVAVAGAVAFLPIGVFAAALPVRDALEFAVGLIVANVPEGLLPTITLALALAVRVLARRHALVKRLSAVETLGSTTVICTDKTGTITENRMRATAAWTPAREQELDLGAGALPGPLAPVWAELARAMAACNEATLEAGAPGGGTGDPTELALLAAAARLGQETSPSWREQHRRRAFRFDPDRKLMTTVDVEADGAERLAAHTKGAPEEVLARSVAVAGADLAPRPLTDRDRARVLEQVERYAQRGLRVLALARRDVGAAAPDDRDAAERDLVFLGLIGMIDPPRPEVAEAVARCRAAGIRIIMVTGDHGATAAAVAAEVGIADRPAAIVPGPELDRMTDRALDALLRVPRPLIFSRSSPEAKLRIADALRAEGHVVAMTGDGVNDAPALRRADIGVAMGRSGTDVAREASTMILTDDNFATIVAAVEEGRRVYDNVRKFVVYILAHLTPEVVPFLLFALSGGAIPLPLTVLQILAIDLGTETLPALALGREPAEPGLMSRPPRPRSENIIRPAMLLRAWGLLGVLSAALVIAAFLFALTSAGWSPGASVAPGTPLHHAYQAATTVTFLGIVACQIGTAFAARTDRASLFEVGAGSNRLLLWGIAFEIAFAAAVVLVPPLSEVFGTAPPAPVALAVMAPFPLLVWGADEIYRRLLRRSRGPDGARRPF